MIFYESNLPGVVQVNPEPKLDERGFFARALGAEESLRIMDLIPA